jgi:hypothetical protein
MSCFVTTYFDAVILGLMKPKPSFFVGIAATLALYPFTGWWLNSSEGVRITLPVLFGVAVLVAGCWERATWLWLGVLAGMTGLLGWLGPGNIWPIVLVVAALLTAVAIGMGALVKARFGRAFKWIFHF